MATLCTVCHSPRKEKSCEHCGTSEPYYNEEAWRGDLPEYLTNMNVLKSRGFTVHFHSSDIHTRRVTPLQLPLYPVWYSKGNLHLWYDTLNQMWVSGHWKDGTITDKQYGKELHFIINL